MQDKLSSTWITLTELGEYFGQTAKEMSICLHELGLREFGPEGQSEPTITALERGLCAPTTSRRGNTFYLWHGPHMIQILQERLQLQVLSAEDKVYRAMALQLLQQCKQHIPTSKPKRDVLVIILNSEHMTKILAWFLVEETKYSGILRYSSFGFLNVLDEAYLYDIDDNLRRIQSELKIDTSNVPYALDYLANPLEVDFNSGTYNHNSPNRVSAWKLDLA